MAFKKLVLTTLFVAITGSVSGQDYLLSVSDGTISEGGSGSLTISLDNNGADMQGWSFGVCNDTASLVCTDAVDGSTTATVNQGGPPGFNQIGIFDEGFTVGVVICFTGCAVLAPGTGYELNVATYDGIAEGTTSVGFCDTLGTPPVETVVVVNGSSVTPTQNSGSVDVVGVPDPEYTYNAGESSANYNPADGNASASVAISIAETDNSGLGAPFPNETQGFSMGISNGSEVTPTAVNLSLPFSADFAESNLLSNGWTIGVVYSFTGGNTLPFPVETTVINADYETGGSMAGDEDGATVALTWDDGLGSPPVANVVVVGGASVDASLDDGSITLNAVVTIDFVRGDANGDERVNIADGIWIIYELFLSGPVSTCPIARDANGDSQVDTADAIYVIHYHLLDGPQPAAPFPDCGQSDGQTPEDCSDSGCSDGGGSAPVTFFDDIQPLFSSACTPCHSPDGFDGNGPSMGLILTENAYDNIVDVPSFECNVLNRVHPGDASMSWLYRKVAGTHVDQDILDLGCCADTDGDGEPDGCGAQMPAFGNCCLDETDIELIAAWIVGGAN